jgi:thioredoxin-like negative regulator of GroEL
MKNQLLASLLLINFYLEASSNNQQTPSKKQKNPKRFFTKKISPVSAPIVLTASNLKTTLSSDLTIVLVGSDWCRWCGLMTPIFEESNIALHETAVHAILSLGGYFGDPTSLLKQVETDYKIKPIKTIPAFLVFKKGKLVEQLSDSQTKEQLSALIKKHTEVAPQTKTVALSVKK